MASSSSVPVNNIHQKHLKSFYSVFSAAGGSSRSKPTWTSLSHKELTESSIFVLINVPVSRVAVLDYFAQLALENVHWFLYQLENPSSAVNIGYIDEAFAEIVQTLQNLVRQKPNKWLSHIFQWTLDTLTEISRRSCNRRALTNCTLSDVLRKYTSNAATKSILDLLNYCIGELLRISPEKGVGALIDMSAKCGNVCDWILTYIGTAYPKAIITQLVNCGLTDFCAFVTEMLQKYVSMTPLQITQRQEQYSREKVASLAAVLGHLARQQSNELRTCFSSLVQEALKPDTTENFKFALPLLLKLAIFSRDISEILVKDFCHLISATNLHVASQIFGRIPQQILFSDNDSLNGVITVIMSLGDSPSSVIVHDILVELTYGKLLSDISLEEQAKEKFKLNVQRSCQRILEVMLTNMEKVVHTQVTYSLEQLHILRKIDSDLHMFVKKLFTENENENRYYFQLLSLLCLVNGSKKTAQILSSIVFMSSTTKHLSSFVCFCRLLTPFQPRVPELFITQLGICYQRLSSMPSVELVDERQWLINLKQLFVWEAEMIRKNELNFLHLIETALIEYASFVEQLLSLAYGPSGMLVLDIFVSIGQPVHLLANKSLRLISLLVRLFYFSLKKISENSESLAFHLCLCDFVSRFVMGQEGFNLEALMKTLFSSIFIDDDWKRLFLSSPSSSVQEFDGLSSNLLTENRTISSKFAAAALVHSGTIGKGARKHVGTDAINESALLKKLAFVRFVDSLCLDRRPQNPQTKVSVFYSRDACRQVAWRLNEHFCSDAIAAEHCWDDWEFSKNYIERFLIVYKRVNELPFGWDLLSIVAEAYPCLWFCLPVIKALLGSIMAQLESAIDKSGKIPARLLCSLEKWFFLVKKGKLLSKPFIFLYEIMPHISSYEAFVVLLQVWSYLQEVAPELKSLEELFECFQVDLYDKVEIIKGDAFKYVEPVRLVMQANIASVGFLFPKVFSVA